MDSRLLTICQRHGVFLTREAAALGYSDRAIARLVAKGSWHRVRHGAYTFEHLWDAAREMERHLILSRAAYRLAGTPVALSHISSLARLGSDWWDLPLEQAHLTRLDGRAGRAMPSVKQHRGRVLAGDVEFEDDLLYMSATRTALEMTTVTDVEHSLVVVNDLLHRRWTTQQRLENRYVDMEQWPHTLTTELVLHLCDRRIESVGETRTFYRIFALGLP
jgi:hypothetical protein